MTPSIEESNHIPNLELNPMLPDDICPRPDRPPPLPTQPFASPIYPASVWQCDSTDQAEALLVGALPGYVYQRDGHPNADAFADKCRDLHRAERVAVTSSGMAAMAAVVLARLRPGDHVVVANQLYGKNLTLLTKEAERFGISHTLVDVLDLSATAAAFRPETKLLVAETISNPLLAVSDLRSLAALAHERGADFLVDNTFATPVLCRPLELGADFVLESVSKMLNGHSDVMLGLLCGRESNWDRVPAVLSAWGLSSSPFDAWLATRGLATLVLRMERACDNAQHVAEFLVGQPGVRHVNYPGLATHPQHALAARQFGGRFGSIVTFHLAGGRTAADAFIRSAKRIPFCPSLGEVSTTLSHPESTSHRALTAEQRAALGITGGTIRLSVGIEAAESIVAAVREGLDGAKG